MNTYVIVPTGGTERVVGNVDSVYDEVAYIAEGVDLYGGHYIHGTYAIAYCDDKRCSGHEVARVYLR